MLLTCEHYAEAYGVKYNPTKSLCMLFSRQQQQSAPDISLNGRKMTWVTEIKHLGNYLSYNLNEETEIQRKKGDLVDRVNCLLGNMGSAPCDVMKKVFQSDCCHFYGSQAWFFNDKAVNSFHKMWNRCVRRLLRLPWRTHCRFLPSLMDCRNSDEQICTRFLSMLRTMCNNSNGKVKFIANRGVTLSCTLIGENISYIKSKQNNLWSMDLLTSRRRLVFTHLSDEDQCALIAIKELMDCNNIIGEPQKTEFCNYLLTT